jgi:hypothetical protein
MYQHDNTVLRIFSCNTHVHFLRSIVQHFTRSLIGLDAKISEFVSFPLLCPYNRGKFGHYFTLSFISYDVDTIGCPYAGG